MTYVSYFLSPLGFIAVSHSLDLRAWVFLFLFTTTHYYAASNLLHFWDLINLSDYGDSLLTAIDLRESVHENTCWGPYTFDFLVVSGLLVEGMQGTSSLFRMMSSLTLANVRRLPRVFPSLVDQGTQWLRQGIPQILHFIYT